MIQPGNPAQLGATPDATGVNFAVFSSAADAVELCLFNASGRQTRWHALTDCANGVWHGYLPGCLPGQRYGYRVRGPYAPDKGERCNPAKLLLDPYARELDGKFLWSDAVFDYELRGEHVAPQINAIDSAPYVPKSVVRASSEARPSPGPRIPWAETIFYELNVRGYTMLHPALDDHVRGRFAGLRSREVLDYLKALGVTSIELMPVHAFIDEHHLAKIGLRNFWGYNSIAFFAPANRYAMADPVSEFRDMVQAIHDAGIEVILDVVYNHTGEGDSRGPTLSLRGLDNLCYYRTEPDRPDVYINDTGCGNTVNVDHPQVRQLVIDSLRYWHNDMGVDGFRFDLAPILGRHGHGFSPSHPMLVAISEDQFLRNTKLVAEPWDPGPGGYRLGEFPKPWAEWNDRYRDAVRRFWRGDQGAGAELAQRLRGSADVFEHSLRDATASVNFISSHDGFTLADIVSYEERHNEANGEDNRDGHARNYSSNYGVEGATDDPAILSFRRQQRLNMLATLLVSQGTPLLLGGDEFGNSQDGNNNAYAQDNETAWLEWSGLDGDPGFAEQVRTLIQLRRSTPLLRLPQYLHGNLQTEYGDTKIDWLDVNGDNIEDHEWSMVRAKNVLISLKNPSSEIAAVSIVINGLDESCDFIVPAPDDTAPWHVAFASAGPYTISAGSVSLPSYSIAVLRNGNA